MKRTIAITGLFAAVLGFGLFVADRSEADTPSLETQVAEVTVETQVTEVAPVPGDGPGCAVEVAKRCSTSSDCPNSKCKSGQCGGCSTSSDCKYGKCKSGQCGGCSTSSDCGGWGKCKSGQCGGCSTSSDCGSFGSCRSGRCEKSPY